MTFIIYNDREPKRPFNGRIKINPNNAYNKHLDNWYYLTFILINSKDFKERLQARNELIICQRKLDYWYRHPELNIEDVVIHTDKLKKEWNTTKQPKIEKEIS